MKDQNVIGYITLDGSLPERDVQEILLNHPQVLQRAIALSGAEPIPLSEIPQDLLKNAQITARLVYPQKLKSFSDGDFVAYYLPQEDTSDPLISPYLLVEQKTGFWNSGGERFNKLFFSCCENSSEDFQTK